MITALDRPLRRLVQVRGEPYVVTLSPAGVRLTRKGQRKGVEVGWEEILSGGVALDDQLARSLIRPSRNPKRKSAG